MLKFVFLGRLLEVGINVDTMHFQTDRLHEKKRSFICFPPFPWSKSGINWKWICIIYIYTLYLIGGIPTPLKNMSSSMGRIIPYIMEHSKCLKPPTRYNIYIYHMLTPAGIFSLGDIYCLSLRWKKMRSFYHRKFTWWMLTLRTTIHGPKSAQNPLSHRIHVWYEYIW